VRVLWLAFILMPSVAPTGAPAPPAPVEAPLDLVEALRIGFEAHPQLQAAESIASGRADETAAAYRAFIPRVVADVRAFQQADPMVGANITLTMPRGKATTEGVNGSIGVEGGSPFGLEYRLAFTDTVMRTDSPLQPFASQVLPTFSLRLSQHLWRGLLPSANLAPAVAADGRARAASADARRARRDVALSIGEAYVQAASDAELVRLQERSLEYARALEKLTRELIEAGKLSAMDLALPLQTVKARETEVSLSRARLRLSQAQLAAALMLPDASIVQRPMSLEPAARWQAPPADVDESVRAALARSPDLEMLRAEGEVVDAEVSAADDAVRPDVRLFVEGRVSGPSGATNCPDGYLPDGVSTCYVGRQFVGGYERAATNLVSGEYYGVQVGVTGAVPVLWSPWTSSARARRADRAALSHEIAAVERRITAQVRGVHGDAIARVQVVALSQEAVLLAEAALAAEDTKLRAGRSTGFDVLRAQENVIAALVQRNAARTQAALSLLRLRAFLLELDPEHAELFGSTTPAQ
jgi:outer membrane protein TolC